MNLDSCYRILDLDPGASPDEVKRAYRELAQVWHPDRFAGKPELQRRAEEKLKEINAAYRTILAAGKDPVERIGAEQPGVAARPAGAGGAAGAPPSEAPESPAAGPVPGDGAAPKAGAPRLFGLTRRLPSRLPALLWETFPGAAIVVLLLGVFGPLRVTAAAVAAAFVVAWWIRARPWSTPIRLGAAGVLAAAATVGMAGFVATPPPVPVLPPPGAGGAAGGPSWRQVALGEDHACGLATDGHAYCWGANDVGQLGDTVAGRRCAGERGGYPCSARPRAVAFRQYFTAVAAGLDYTCALDGEGRAFCWGANFAGQLGDGSFAQRSRPVAVAGDLRFRTLSALGQHTCGLTTAGVAYCWGRDTDGQLGDPSQARECRYQGTVFGCSPVPVAVPSPWPWAEVVAGASHSCALTAAGAAWCWGADDSGQLGADGPAVCEGDDGGHRCALRPDSVATNVHFRQLAAGAAHTCGLTADGQAWCWGRNDAGQLGIRSTRDASRPTPVHTGARFTALRAGGYHTCGLTPGGALECWGRNGYGQLGRTTLLTCGGIPCSRSPGRARIRGQATRVAAGFVATCAGTAADEEVCWGPDDSGQRGTGVVVASGSGSGAATAARGAPGTHRPPRSVGSFIGRVFSAIWAPIERLKDRLQRIPTAAADRVQ